MGIRLRCEQGGKSIDMGYGGLALLRQTVAKCCGPQVGKHYGLLRCAPWLTPARTEYFKHYDQTTEQLIKAEVLDKDIADFLYEPDTDGYVPYSSCQKLLKVIGNYNDNIIYGYAGRPDPAKFADFKAILQECVEKKCGLMWS